MTSAQTSTGTWQVSYNGANRPVRFRNEESDTTIDCGYDSQGRRLHFPKHREILKIPFVIRKRISCYFP